LFEACHPHISCFPTYPCLDFGDGVVRALVDATIPDLETDRLRAAAAFHGTIAEHVKKGGGGYQFIAIKDHVQPTAQSALLRAGRIEPINTHKGVDHGGDGTVPRPSSHPPEWNGDSSAVFAAQKHASLQNTDSVLHQLFGALTGNLGKWMGGERIGVEVPTLVSVGERVPVLVLAEAGDPTLPLQTVVMNEAGVVVGEPRLLDSDGEGGYHTEIPGLAAGTYESAVSQRPVEPVTDITLVWDSAVGV
jgi:hypothetical protein